MLLFVATILIAMIFLNTPDDPKADETGNSGLNPSQNVGWRKATLREGGLSKDVEYRIYDNPIPLNLISRPNARRDTPLDALQSAMTSIASGSKFEEFLEHFLNPEIQKGLVLGHYSEEGFVKHIKKEFKDGRYNFLGEVQVDGHTVVVFTWPGPSGGRYIVGSVMTLKDGKYYIDEKAKRKKGIFRLMSAQDYSFITGEK